MAMDGRMPVVAAVEGRMNLPRRQDIGIACAAVSGSAEALPGSRRPQARAIGSSNLTMGASSVPSIIVSIIGGALSGADG